MKVWLTHNQATLVRAAVQAQDRNDWALEHLGHRDDLELLEEHGFVETQRKRGVGFIAFRCPPGRLILKLHDGYHLAV